MKLLFPRLWVALVAVAFALLWALGLTAAPTYADALWPRLVGIWGWGLVGLGFFGVALTARLASRPRKIRRLVRVACAPKKPLKLPTSIYTPPPYRRYHHNVARR